MKEMKARHGNQQEELEEEQEMIINRLLRKIQQLELKITVLQERNDELTKSPKAAKVLLLFVARGHFRRRHAACEPVSYSMCHGIEMRSNGYCFAG